MLELHYGAVSIHLRDNLSYKWTVGEAGCVRGYAYVGEKCLKGEAFLSYLEAVSGPAELLEKIVSLNGLYSFILHTAFGVAACVDQIRSMPLFYRGTELFDALGEEEIRDWAIDPDALAVYRNCVFTPHKKTLFKDTFQVQTGCYLLLNSAGAHQYPHFTMAYARRQVTDIDEAVRILDESLTQTVRRTIAMLNGRTAVIPLSGGHDSRILAFYLRRLGYRKIIAYSYGLPGNNDAVCSQRVAEILEIPWHFVSYDPKEMRPLYEREFRRFALFVGNGTSLPHLQEWFAAEQLRKRGVLPEDCVFVPGYGGDFTAGEFVWRDAAQAEPISIERLLAFIMKSEFRPDYLLGRENMCGAEDGAVIRRALREEFPELREAGRTFTGKEANQIVERAILTGWYSKFIANAIRVFDFLGYEWLMPFFERSQFETWSRIDHSLRRFRAAYFEQAKRVYPDALNAIGFAWPEIMDMDWEEALRREPSFGHFMYGYLDVDTEEYHQQIREKVLKTPNVYFQDRYVEILREICGGGKRPL